jgi:hypothetical protein
MGEVIRFVPKSERERARLIRKARAIYDSIFPPADPVSGQQDKATLSHAVSGAYAHRSDGVLLSCQDHRRALQSFLSGKLPRADRHHLGLR